MREDTFLVALLAFGLFFSFTKIVNSVSLANCVTRRTAVTFASTSVLLPIPALSYEDVNTFSYATRDRKGNKDALIQADYWYMAGRLPPRVLENSLTLDDPKWNTFGSCETTNTAAGTSNSCTYVSLKQRIPAYSKYGYAISDGAKEYGKLGALLQYGLQNDASFNDICEEALTFITTPDKIPPAIIDAELKMILFATAMLTSPTFPTPGRELLVARYYVNEAHFAAKEMASAFTMRDASRSIQAWQYGRDSWNSYFQIVNKSISPKVGEPFPKIL